MLEVLANTAGNDAQDAIVSVGTSATGYDPRAVISGPRSRLWRSDGTGAAATVGYETLNSGTLDVDHVVVARADKLLTSGGVTLKTQEKDSGGTWSNLDSLAIASSDLVGIHVGYQTHGQDYVKAITPSNKYGYRIRGEMTSEAICVSKVYFSAAFNFGTNPVLFPAPNWEELPKDSFFKPYRGTMAFETTHVITMSWQALTRAKIDAFKALPAILQKPIFLYDADQEVLQWKLENVIVESWTEEFIETDVWNLDITFRRLAHYE